MGRFSVFATTVLTLCLSQEVCRADEAINFDGFIRPFLARHCQDCHGAAAQEGNLRLDNLSPAFSDRRSAERWATVLRKLRAGEMPPKEEPQPEQQSLESITDWVEHQLVAADVHRRRTQGRVVLRRLNRVEYENTIRDLLAIDIDLKDALPEDGTAHGFDNIGHALSLSSVLLERYLEAADAALDAAIQTGPRPETRKARYSYKDERRVKDHKSYLPVDDALVFFSSGYSPTEINQFRASADGNYRIRVSAYAYQSDVHQTFRVYGSYGASTHLVGHFDVDPQPTVAEMVSRLGYRTTIRVVPYGTYLRKWNAAASETGPGVAVQWVEIEGPLIDQWPPASHTRLFGELPIEVVNSEEVRRNRRIKPRLEVVSDNPESDASAILARVLPKMFRRPVTTAMAEPYLEMILTTLDDGYTFQEAVRVGLKAALCSPDFLYLAMPESAPASLVPTDAFGLPLNDYELAARLSYFLWSSMPDDELFALAAAGTLSQQNTLREQTERMLNDPRAARFTSNFVGQWLDLREIDFTSPDAMLYPEFDELLKVSMVKETELFFDELLKHDLSVLNFVDSDFAILNERLARLYGIPDVIGHDRFQKVSLSEDSPRGGVLTQASVLKVTANGTNTSPVLRGVWVLDNILGKPAPPPPANVPAVEPDIRGATSIRDQLAKHRQIESCASCHRHIDPAGFALEQFDVIGGLRTNYRSIGEGAPASELINGRRVRYRIGLPVESGDIMPDGEQFRDVREFKQLLLRDRRQIVRCVAEKLMAYATGGGISFADHAGIEKIVTGVDSQGSGLRSLIHEVIQSSVFQHK